MMVPRNCARCAPLIVLLLAWTVSPAADWPQWRGPQRTGHVPADAAIPASLPKEPKVHWRVKVGEGLASPVVASGRVLLFDNQDGRETLRALDAAGGGELWRAAIDDVFSDNQAPSGPRCTPMADGDRVYAQSCRGELQCLRLADGRKVWGVNYVRDFGAEFIGEKGSAQGAVRHGYNGAPAIDGDRLFAQVGSTNGASVVCFKKQTGEVVWKSQNDQAAYAAPMVATMAGVKQIVAFTCDGAYGLDVRDGKLLWRVPFRTAFSRHVTTPIIREDMVVVSSHQVGLIGIKISREGTGLKADRAWISKEAAMNFSSPVSVGNYLYGLGPAKNIVCVDIPTGRLVWSQEGWFTTPADKAHAAFLVMGKNILTLTDGGLLVLFEANAVGCKEIGRAQVCGLNWCNPAYADGKLYVRDGVKTTGELYCVDLIH